MFLTHSRSSSSLLPHFHPPHLLILFLSSAGLWNQRSKHKGASEIQVPHSVTSLSCRPTHATPLLVLFPWVFQGHLRLNISPAPRLSPSPPSALLPSLHVSRCPSVQLLRVGIGDLSFLTPNPIPFTPVTVTSRAVIKEVGPVRQRQKGVRTRIHVLA